MNDAELYNNETRPIRLKLNVLNRDILDYIKTITRKDNEAELKAIAKDLIENHWDPRFNYLSSLKELIPNFKCR